jgi:hypothetical protein
MLNDEINKYPQIKDNCVDSNSNYLIKFSIILESRVVDLKRCKKSMNLDKYPWIEDNSVELIFDYH